MANYNEEKNLSTGFTSNNVVKIGNTIIKKGKLIELENDWYSSFKDKNYIPKILSYQNNCLVLEYIENDGNLNLNNLYDLIECYKKYDKLNDLKFETYVENIKTHLIKNRKIKSGKKLLNLLSKLEIKSTFSHGDLSVMNMIQSKSGLKLIDPLYSKNKFGSYEIDLAKLCFSLKFYNNDIQSFLAIKQKYDIKYLDILIAAEAVRVSSYKKEYSLIAENLINEL